ncbi:MAG: hypothetical protein HC848_08135, partial [Limnobacter sp.]|nr:hypothetical protein [Limnobacter sp.]
MKQTQPQPVLFPQGVYALTPNVGLQCPPDLLLNLVRACLEGGVQWLQFRQKNLPPAQWWDLAQEVGCVCRQFGTHLVLNDAPLNTDVLQIPAVVGVHLGRHDAGVEPMRACLGPGAVVGASCYNSPIWPQRHRRRVPVMWLLAQCLPVSPSRRLCMHRLVFLAALR